MRTEGSRDRQRGRRRRCVHNESGKDAQWRSTERMLFRTPSDWADHEEVLSDEWGIGGQAMTIDAVRALVAGKLKTLEET